MWTRRELLQKLGLLPAAVVGIPIVSAVPPRIAPLSRALPIITDPRMWELAWKDVMGFVNIKEYAQAVVLARHLAANPVADAHIPHEVFAMLPILRKMRLGG